MNAREISEKCVREHCPTSTILRPGVILGGTERGMFSSLIPLLKMRIIPTFGFSSIPMSPVSLEVKIIFYFIYFFHRIC